MSHFEYLLSSLCLFNSAFRSTLDSEVQRSCSLLPSTGWIKQNYVVNVATHCETQTLTALKMNKSRTISFKLKILKGFMSLTSISCSFFLSLMKASRDFSTWDRMESRLEAQDKGVYRITHRHTNIPCILLNHDTPLKEKKTLQTNIYKLAEYICGGKIQCF